jgi:hypothetical protein
MIYIKKYNTDNGVMLAMCDADLIDKVLKDGDIEINIKDYSDFYKGELVDSKNAKSIINAEGIQSANVIGKESVGAAIENSIIEETHVKRIKNVPYAQAYSTKY